MRALVRTASCKPSTQEKFDLLANFWPNDRHEQAARFGHSLMPLRLAHYKRDFNLSNISILRLELAQLKLFFWPTTFISSGYAKRWCDLILTRLCLYWHTKMLIFAVYRGLHFARRGTQLIYSRLCLIRRKKRLNFRLICI